MDSMPQEPPQDESKKPVREIRIVRMDSGKYLYQAIGESKPGEDMGAAVQSYEFDEPGEVMKAVQDDLESPHLKKPPLGSGERFRQLEGKLENKGAKNPAALAAWIGRRKYGSQKFSKLSAAGRNHAFG